MIKRGRFYIAAAFITVVAGVVACTLTAVEQSDSIDIIKSDNDHRDYKLVVLSNRLRVLLISDSSTDKAAASLDVYVGSRQDPQTRQGLAHFLEHMLFLGTSKYPQAGEYQAFINKHNGSHNAYTSFEHTNYFFDLDPVYLDEALDRFSQFFISPLLTEAYVEREKNAVHSEYRAKIKSEQRKGLDVFKSIINPKHPFAKFSVGNLETLANVKGTPVLRDQLLAFYNTHYSANVMTLVVMGRESIEDLEVIVSEKFSAIPNTDKRIDAIEEPLFSDGSLPLYVTVKAEKDQRVLSIMFPTEEEMPYFQQKPMYYLGNIIGHEGQGSLLSYLKKRGWAESLSAGPGLSYKGGGSFSIAIALTEKGLIKSDQVIRAVFQAINRVEDSVAASWLFNEQAMLAQQQFRYLERSSPSSYVSGVATNLHYYPAAQVLSGAYLMSDFDSPLITHFLSYLNPDNAVVTLNAPDVAVDTVSPFYATQYQSKGVSKKTLNEWNDVGLNPLITLPKPNEFIVDNVELKNSEETELLPLLITNDAGLRVWFKHDDDFQIPKGSVFVNLRSSLANDSVEHSVLLSLFASMLSDELNEFSYPAILAGLNYSVGKNQRGLSVKISGFNDKQTLLLDKILAALTSFSFDSQRFDNIKQEHIRQLANAKKQQPYRLLMSQLNEILYRNKWSNPQLLSAYKKTSVQDLQAYAKLLLSDMTIDVLVHGNYLEVEAKQLGDKFGKTLISNVKALPKIHIAQLPQEQLSYQMTNEYSDASVLYYSQSFDVDKHSRAAMAITALWLKSDFYSQLRTEKQLGYVVVVGPYPVRDVSGIMFMIQSPVAGPGILQKEINLFVEQKLQEIESTTQSEFDQYRQALIQRLSESPKNLLMQSERYWQDIMQNQLQFDSRVQLVFALESMTLEQWKVFFREQVAGETRRSIWVYSAGKFSDQPLRDTKKIENVTVFKAKRRYYQFP